jgi:DNA-binding SARP family transcriptional activator/tetratricopeptide (TPR) repeat protein
VPVVVPIQLWWCSVTLRIYLLGQFKLQHDEQPIELPSRPAQSLFAYLAMNSGIPHRRERLAGLLWPDSTEENARGYLRQALWRIRKSLDEVELDWEEFLESDKISITFKADSDHWLDTSTLQQDTDNLSLEEVGVILKHYQGELLPGFYDEWVPVERERFQTIFHQKMSSFMDALILNREWEQVFQWGEAWIRLAHVPEGAYQALMRAYAAVGDKAMVQSTFERCRKALKSDLGVEVSHETAALLEDLVRKEETLEPAHTLLEKKQADALPAFLDDPKYTAVEKVVFVARQSELGELIELLDETIAGQGKAVFITGEAGSGKTALLSEFMNQALDSHPDLIVASGHCNAQTGIGDPYLPMREALEMLTGDVGARLEAGSLTREHAIRLWDVFPRTLTALVNHGPDLIGTFITDEAILERSLALEAAFPSIVERLRNHIQHRLPPRYSTGIQQLAFFEQYARVIRDLASAAPLVLVLDDLQWADAGSIGLLFHLGREISGCPILILGSYRQEELALGRGDERHPLEPVINEFQRLFGTHLIDLGRADTQEFIDEFLDSEPNQLGKPFREMLYRHTQGHALFTVELLRKMQESGELIKDEDGFWHEGAMLDWDSMPARVEAVVAERINRLPPATQSVLRMASVQGEIFTAEILAEVLDMDTTGLLALLSSELDRTHRIVRAESIHRIGEHLISSYRFRHTLFQKYLYSTLDEIELVHLHQAFGIATERLIIDQPVPSAHALQLALHFEIAGMMDKAIDYLHQAGDRAVQLSAYTEGISHLSRALELLESQEKSRERDEKELSLQHSIAMSWKYNWASMKGSKAIDRIRELSKKLDRNAPLIRMLGEESIYYYVLADYENALTSANECLVLAEQEDEPLLITEAHWLLGVFNFSTGQYLTALEHLDEVDSFYVPNEHHQLLIQARGVDAGLSAQSYRACSLWCLGYPDQALHLSDEAIRLARQFNHPFTMADVLSYAVCLLYSLVGDAEALKEGAQNLASLSERANLSLAGWAGMSNYFLGKALTLQGKPEQAISVIEAAIETSDTTGVDLYKPMALSFLAWAQLEVGDADSALKNLENAFSIVSNTGERIWEVELLRLRAKALQAGGNLESAEADFKKAIKIASSQEAKSWELRVAIDLAHLWLDQGKRKDASKLLSDCYQWFTEGFKTPDLKRARELLDSMV